MTDPFAAVRELIRALGLDPDKVVHVNIDFPLGGMPTLTVTEYATAGEVIAAARAVKRFTLTPIPPGGRAESAPTDVTNH